MTEEQNLAENNAQTESIVKIVKKILTSEVKYILGIIIFLAGVVAPYYQIRQDIELIKQNHFHHIENIQGEILAIKQEQLRNQDTIIKLMEKLSEIKYNK